MSALEWITTGILVLAMFGIGGLKLSGNKDGIEQAERLGYDKILIPLGITEVSAGAGVLIGAIVADLEWLGTAAAVGVVLMMIGAAGLHIRARDRFEIIPAIVVGTAAVLYIIAINAN